MGFGEKGLYRKLMGLERERERESEREREGNKELEKNVIQISSFVTFINPNHIYVCICVRIWFFYAQNGIWATAFSLFVESV